jgi:hypothetical protein
LHAQKYGIFLERKGYSLTECVGDEGKDVGICLFGQTLSHLLSLKAKGVYAFLIVLG